MKGIFPLISIMWAIYFLNAVLLGGNLIQYGIVARTGNGLIGIALSPFLHIDLMHLISNTIPLLILPIFLSMSEGKNKMWAIVWIGIASSGLITWTFGSSEVVIVGASGLVFVLIGYLLTDCLFNPCKRSIPAGLATLLLFGGSVFSLYHFRSDISLAAHAGGFLTGIVLAKKLGGKTSSRA